VVVVDADDEGRFRRRAGRSSARRGRERNQEQQANAKPQ
jgi:hypothetical protein